MVDVAGLRSFPQSPSCALPTASVRGGGWGRANSKVGEGSRAYPQGTRWPELPRCSCWSRTWSRTGSRWWSGSTSAEGDVPDDTPAPRHSHPHKAPSLCPLPQGHPTPLFSSGPPPPGPAGLGAQAGHCTAKGNGVSCGWLDRGKSKCTDLPRIPTEIHLFVLKGEEKEGQAGLGSQRQQRAQAWGPGWWRGSAFWYCLRSGSAYWGSCPGFPLLCGERRGVGARQWWLCQEAVGVGDKSDLGLSFDFVLSTWGSLDECLNISERQFLPLENVDDTIYLTGHHEASDMMQRVQRDT